MRLGISSYTYPWATRLAAGEPGRMNAHDLIDQTRAFGLDVLQLADAVALHALGDAEIDAIGAHAVRTGVSLELGTRAESAEQIQAYLTLAAQLNARLLRVSLRGQASAAAIELIGSAVPQLEAVGVRLVLETHETLRAQQLLHIVETVASPWVGVCFDTANSLGCLEGAAQVFATVARHIVNVHIKDVRARRNADNSGFVIEGVPAGQGQIDLPDLFAQLRALDRPLSLILENWVPGEATLAATLEKERLWAAEGVAYCRGKV